MNDRQADEVIRFLEEVKVGLAVETQHGLLVLVARDAGRKSAGHIESQLTALSKRALSGVSTIDDLTRQHIYHVSKLVQPKDVVSILHMIMSQCYNAI